VKFKSFSIKRCVVWLLVLDALKDSSAAETSGTTRPSTQPNSPGDLNLQWRRRIYLKTRKCFLTKFGYEKSGKEGMWSITSTLGPNPGRNWWLIVSWKCTILSVRLYCNRTYCFCHFADLWPDNCRQYREVSVCVGDTNKKLSKRRKEAGCSLFQIIVACVNGPSVTHLTISR